MAIRMISTVILLVIFKPLLAYTDIGHVNNYWQCNASDREKKQWIGRGAYSRVASSKAFEACKKESHAPTSCISSEGVCEYYVHGVSTSVYGMNEHAQWQCVALDQMAKSWESNINSNRDDAALEAKAFCHEHSSVPDSCYINLLTCKNINGS